MLHFSSNAATCFLNGMRSINNNMRLFPLSLRLGHSRRLDYTVLGHDSLRCDFSAFTIFPSESRYLLSIARRLLRRTATKSTSAFTKMTNNRTRNEKRFHFEILVASRCFCTSITYYSLYTFERSRSRLSSTRLSHHHGARRARVCASGARRQCGRLGRAAVCVRSGTARQK